MKGRDVRLLLLLGLIIWVIGTIYCANYGPAIMETTSARYWGAFALSPIVSAILCLVILRRGTSSQQIGRRPCFCWPFRE
jgi:hypothetical protein